MPLLRQLHTVQKGITGVLAGVADNLIVLEIAHLAVEFRTLYDLVNHLVALALGELQGLDEMTEVVVVGVASEVHLPEDGSGLTDIGVQYLLYFRRDMIVLDDVVGTGAYLAKGALEVALTGCTHTGCYLGQLLDDVERTVVPDRGGDIPRQSGVAEVLLHVRTVDERPAHHVVIVFLHDHRGLALRFLKTGIQTALRTRELVVAKHVAVLEVLARGSPILDPIHTVAVEALPVHHRVKTTFPALLNGTLCRHGAYTKRHVEIEHGADVEEGRNLGLCQLLPAFLGIMAHVVVHPFLQETIEVGHVIVFVVVTVEQDVDTHVLVVLIKKVSNLAAQEEVEDIALAQLLHILLLTRTSAWEVQKVVVGQHVHVDALTVDAGLHVLTNAF